MKPQLLRRLKIHESFHFQAHHSRLELAAQGSALQI